MIDADPAESTRDTPVTAVSPGVAVSVSLLQQNTSVHNDVRAVTSESGCPADTPVTSAEHASTPRRDVGPRRGARGHRHGGQWPLRSELRAIAGRPRSCSRRSRPLTVGCRLWSTSPLRHAFRKVSAIAGRGDRSARAGARRGKSAGFHSRESGWTLVNRQDCQRGADLAPDPSSRLPDRASRDAVLLRFETTAPSNSSRTCV
jgi:hypothetical protein